MLRNPLPDMVKMVEGILKYKSIPDRWKVRFQLHLDPVAGKKFVDMRGLLEARLLALNDGPLARDWIKQGRRNF